METQRYDHLDDVPLAIKQALNNDTPAMPVNQRIATVEEHIKKDAQSPPKKKQKGKGRGATSSLLTSTNQRSRKEIAEKSLVNTYE